VRRKSRVPDAIVKDEARGQRMTVMADSTGVKLVARARQAEVHQGAKGRHSFLFANSA
jgi:hypothetical protein